jgi:hypothetical protein
MEAISVTCNHCGAPLEVGETARFVTCLYCKSQLEIKRTESAVYTEVLERIDDRTEKIAEDVSAIRRAQEIENLDREWSMRRETFYTTNKRGERSLPSVAGSLVGAAITVPFGIFWTIMASNIGGHMGGPGAFFPLFGVLFVVVGIGMAISGVSKANQYRREEDDYNRRRDELTRDYDRR